MPASTPPPPSPAPSPAPPTVRETALAGLPAPHRGKVRDLYDLGDSLLLVASDRLSAFDVVLPDPIPWKGHVLTALSLFWFELLRDVTPNHLLAADVERMPAAVRRHADLLRGRALWVKKATVFPLECVVRGYLAGSGWKEYQISRTVCGIPLPAGLRESDRLPEPIFTPSTKATVGHDENISFARAAELVGGAAAERLRELSLAVYRTAAEFARGRGIILCDTKLEWGEHAGGVILVDEVLTPDSSRFWPADRYAPGGAQPSYDKQYVRDYLESLSWDKRPPGPVLPAEVIAHTSGKYLEAYRRITGRELTPG
ncbi:MAG: phosphoribosylaminoimidazolesuccinocarboxamide synthase [Planctomycetes bacterium]|nr:phosphoribosylaminoimidazolesuccinocarboxamide synthase [Planctomycetota bacterium]